MRHLRRVTLHERNSFAKIKNRNIDRVDVMFVFNVETRDKNQNKPENNTSDARTHGQVIFVFPSWTRETLIFDDGRVLVPMSCRRKKNTNTKSDSPILVVKVVGICF